MSGRCFDQAFSCFAFITQNPAGFEIWVDVDHPKVDVGAILERLGMRVMRSAPG
jgi:hypothetical protein